VADYAGVDGCVSYVDASGRLVVAYPAPSPELHSSVPARVREHQSAAGRPVPGEAAVVAVMSGPLLERARRELFTVTDLLHVARRTLETAHRDGWAGECAAIADDVARLRADIEGEMP
jgi:hypothetical protein